MKIFAAFHRAVLALVVPALAAQTIPGRRKPGQQTRAYLALLAVMALGGPLAGQSQTYVCLTETPDYTWHAGCFGTASGNLAGFWDRHGLPDFYTGPVNGGVAPLNSGGANADIRGLWASEAGVDGRPANKPGHMNDYYSSYEYAGADPFVAAGRKEHAPDCTGDFIGLSQNKWTNSNQLNNECRGNIDMRFLFQNRSDCLYISFLGNHDEVKALLRSGIY